jgi:hypothetical protein
MLHALIYRQYGKVTRAAQSAVIVKRLQAAQHAGLAVFHRYHAIHIIRPRQVQRFFRNASTAMRQQMFGFVPQQLHDVRHDLAPSGNRNGAVILLLYERTSKGLSVRRGARFSRLFSECLPTAESKLRPRSGP